MAASLHNDGLSGGPPKFFTFAETRSGALLVGSCVRGLARSDDGGGCWEPVGSLEHVSVNTFAIEPGGTVLAATSGGLWRSADEGSTWHRLDEEPIYATLPSGPDRPPGVTTFRLFELSDGRLLAGTDGEGVWIRDGEAWTRLGLAGSIVYSLAETATGALLAGTRGQGVVRSDDGGTTWAPSSTALPDVYVHCLLELGDGSLLAGTGHGLSRSFDDGCSWAPYSTELEGHRIFSVHGLADGRLAAGSYAHMWIGEGESWRRVDPGLTPDEAWTIQFGEDGTIYGGTKTGVLRSDDRGETWRNVAPGSVVFALTKTAAGEILAGGDAGVRVSPDWAPVGELGPRAYALFEVAPDHVLAGTLTEGLYQYRDDAWGPVPDGPPHWQVYQVMRSVSGRLLACTGAIIDGNKVGGVFTSDDEGSSWQETLSGRSYYNLAQTTSGDLYAGGRRCYISHSVDDGESWVLCPLPLGQEAKMYSLFADSQDRLFLGAGGQLLRSEDGAQSWTLLDEGIDGVSVYDLEEGPDGLLAAATSAGLFASEDGGDTWRAGQLA